MKELNAPSDSESNVDIAYGSAEDDDNKDVTRVYTKTDIWKNGFSILLFPKKNGWTGFQIFTKKCN